MNCLSFSTFFSSSCTQCISVGNLSLKSSRSTLSAPHSSSIDTLDTAMHNSVELAIVKYNRYLQRRVCSPPTITSALSTF